jgi:hypothetical protein
VEASRLLSIHGSLTTDEYAFGSYVAGHCRINGQIWEDWALIRVNDERRQSASNSAPGRPNSRVIGYADARGGEIVQKHGRTTGFRLGRINGALGVRISQSGPFTREHAIIPSEGGQFSFNGDSGAWVINSFNKVVGMIFAGDPVEREDDTAQASQDGPFSFMTDFRHLMAYIKAEIPDVEFTIWRE